MNPTDVVRPMSLCGDGPLILSFRLKAFQNDAFSTGFPPVSTKRVTI
jgi:hypothetical protein